MVTLGSPLSATEVMQRTIGDLKPFPYSKVGCWVNVYSRWDWVSGGKPLARRVHPVVDLPIGSRGPGGLRDQHGRSSYFRHPLTARVIAEGMTWADSANPVQRRT